jgi:hypothetical protein
MRDSMPNARKLQKNGSDHFANAIRKSPRFWQIFLTHGEYLSTIQRIGVFILSLMMTFQGAFFAYDVIDSILNNEPRILFSGFLAIFLSTFGLIGLRNVFRRKK